MANPVHPAVPALVRPPFLPVFSTPRSPQETSLASAGTRCEQWVGSLGRLDSWIWIFTISNDGHPTIENEFNHLHPLQVCSEVLLPSLLPLFEQEAAD